MKGKPVVVFILIVAFSGCGGSDGATAEDCQKAIDKMAECYPDLAREAHCTAETYSEFQRLAVEGKDCSIIDEVGKADGFSFGDCDENEHTCGWVFCCDNCVINWTPSSESNWDIIGVVEDFQGSAPAHVLFDYYEATREELLEGWTRSFEQSVSEYPGVDEKDMAVELTARLVPVSLGNIQKHFRVQDWGIHLAHYLGGEVKVYAKGADGLATRQVERMVLSALPFNWDLVMMNNDMTKVEVIKYESERVKVYWRVMYSDNGSTETDVGSVEFFRYDDVSTLITFHSAHRLNAVGLVHIPNNLILSALSNTFLDHLAHYAELADGI